MEAIFETLADHVQGRLQAGETFTASFHGESSDFVRINHGRLRQPGHVTQTTFGLRLLQGARHASASVSLSGQVEADRARIDGALAGLRAALPHLPEDPHLLLHQSDVRTRSVGADRLPPAADLVDAALEAAAGTDMVGVFAGGTLARGFASSWGQRSWYARTSFDLDWSLVHDADKAVKQTLAGETFDSDELARTLAEGRRQLALLDRPSMTVKPGRYRAWLTPAAMEELLGVLQWGGFSQQAVRTKQSPIQRLYEGKASLDPRVTLLEDIDGGVAPDFQEDGFLRPPAVTLVDAGAAAAALTSPRTAREYDLDPNGASAHEQPEALRMVAGDLADADVLARLGTGVWVSNLWYLNYSDRQNARVTGMTRFATFWVEDGEIKAPLSVMRFDDTVFDLLGDRLEAVGARAPVSLNNSTYFERSTGNTTTPGVLLNGLSFTL
jgi:predicted Zn-dependent protease